MVVKRTKEQLVLEAEQRLEKLQKKKSQVMDQIRQEEDKIRMLQKQIKEEKIRSAIQRVEISGVDLDELLNELGKKAKKEDDEHVC